MAAMRAWKGSLLEENIARTAGSIGESVAAGAIFTLPAFLLAKAWPSFPLCRRRIGKSTALIMVGSILGVLFYFFGAACHGGGSRVTLPESLAASEIIKPDNAARKPRNISSGISALAAWSNPGKVRIVRRRHRSPCGRGQSGHSQVRLGTTGSTHIVPTGGTSVFAAPSVSPAYLGVGYIIGVPVASIQFAAAYWPGACWFR